MSARPVRLAVLGDPIDHSRSPDLHRAGLAAIGLSGTSRALRTSPAELGERLVALAADGYRGVNLTAPLKETALAHLASVSDASRRARSVNTVGFDPEAWWGDTTDGAGFVDLLESLGRAPDGSRVHLLGGGGAARSLACASRDAGAEVTVAVRRPAEAAEAWQGIAARLVAWGSEAARSALAHATVVVNATPVAASELPLDDLPEALVIDLTYGAELTPWTTRVRALGREAYDGLGLLVFQARRSLERWTGRDVPLDPLARAVGWPR